MTEESLFGNQTGDMRYGRLVKMCLLCGCLAADTAVHVRWHEGIAK